ncbi:MAG: class I SAM-dependent methyltransferase [Chloroherpetonaceae bacterium]|nr:class I SAM-dependent methyltransferase [Chloroherpetonaceae bacterium]
MKDRCDEMQAFYACLWSTDKWGRAEPNEDERQRMAAITALMALWRETAEGLRILDLGCGRGWLTHQLSRYGQVVGVDPVPAAIERARSLFPALDFRVADAGSALAQFGAEAFDLIVSSEVIEHIPDAEKRDFLRTIRQMLAPGGALILTTPRGEAWRGWRYWHPEDQPVEEWVREADLPALCRSAGLVVCARRRVFVTGTWHSWLSRVVTARRLSPLMERLRNFPPVRGLRYHCSIYQAVLCRPEEEMSGPCGAGRRVE